MIFYLNPKFSHTPTKLLQASKIEMYVILWPVEDESLTLTTWELK